MPLKEEQFCRTFIQYNTVSLDDSNIYKRDPVRISPDSGSKSVVWQLTYNIGLRVMASEAKPESKTYVSELSSRCSQKKQARKRQK